MCQLLLPNVQTCLWLCHHHVQIWCSPAGFGVRIQHFVFAFQVAMGLLKEIMGIRCFCLFQAFISQNWSRRRGMSCLQPRVSFSIVALRCFLTLFSSYRASLSWKGIVSGKLNLLTVSGLIIFQFCKSVWKLKGDKEAHVGRGGCHSAVALFLLGSAVLPVGILVNDFQPFEYVLLFQVHWFI